MVDGSSALERLKAADDTLDGFLSASSGYALFPVLQEQRYSFVLFGGGQTTTYGSGLVHDRSTFVGYAQIYQARVWVRNIAGQTFTELVVFESKADLDHWINYVGGLDLGPLASATIVKSGAAASTKYVHGVAVFVKPIGDAVVEGKRTLQLMHYVGN